MGLLGSCVRERDLGCRGVSRLESLTCRCVENRVTYITMCPTHIRVQTAACNTGHVCQLQSHIHTAVSSTESRTYRCIQHRVASLQVCPTHSMCAQHMVASLQGVPSTEPRTNSCVQHRVAYVQLRPAQGRVHPSVSNAVHMCPTQSHVLAGVSNTESRTSKYSLSDEKSEAIACAPTPARGHARSLGGISCGNNYNL